MTKPGKVIGRIGRALLNAKSLQVAEIVGVFMIGVAVLLSGLRLFGHSPVASIVSIWLANLAMLAAIYFGLRSRAQGWGHLGLRDSIFDPKSIWWIALRSIPVFILAILAFAVGAIVMANIVGVPEAADMSKYDYLRGNLGLTILALASVYVVSSFAEEAIYRGFLITRIIELARGLKMSHCFAIALGAPTRAESHAWAPVDSAAVAWAAGWSPGSCEKCKQLGAQKPSTFEGTKATKSPELTRSWLGSVR